MREIPAIVFTYAESMSMATVINDRIHFLKAATDDPGLTAEEQEVYVIEYVNLFSASKKFMLTHAQVHGVLSPEEASEVAYDPEELALLLETSAARARIRGRTESGS